jgi:hypothetical protein
MIAPLSYLATSFSVGTVIMALRAMAVVVWACLALAAAEAPPPAPPRPALSETYTVRTVELSALFHVVEQ